MDLINILAQATEPTAQQTQQQEIVQMQQIWQHIISLNLVEALTFISFGVICLLYGWRIFKILVVISFALIGLTLGIKIGNMIQGSTNQVLSGLIGMGVLAVISVPLMKYAVSVLGAVAGGVLTAAIWFGCGLNENYIWAGALIGIIAGGMISFIIFRIAVMLFSSLGGSTLMVFGMLALLYLYPETKEQIKHIFFDYKWFFPLAIMVPTAIGLFAQNRFIKKSKDWSV